MCEESKPFEEMDVVEQMEYLHKHAKKQDFIEEDEENQVNTLDFEEKNT